MVTSQVSMGASFCLKNMGVDAMWPHYRQGQDEFPSTTSIYSPFTVQIEQKQALKSLVSFYASVL